jgi:WD40 repeat protein
MKRLLLLISLIGLIGLACSGTTLTASTVTPTLQPSATEAAATATPVPPTATEEPTATETPTPTPPAISAQNAVQVDKLGEVSSPSLRKVVFSPDGKFFATSAGNDGDFGVKIWQSQGGVLIRSITGFSGIVWDAAFSPDGQWIATAANDQAGQHLRIWNVSDGRQLVTLDGPGTASSVAFSPDGSHLAVGGMSDWPLGEIWIYDTTSWKRLQVLPATGQNVLALVFRPDSNHLISSGTDGIIRVWTWSKGTIQKTMLHGLQANRLALSPDDSLMASTYCSATGTNGCTKGGILIWRTVDWVIVQQFSDLAESVAFSADGSMLISGSGANDAVTRIRNTKDWTVVKTLPGQAYSVAMSPDNRLLISSSFTSISLWGMK